MQEKLEALDQAVQAMAEDQDEKPDEAVQAREWLMAALAPSTK